MISWYKYFLLGNILKYCLKFLTLTYQIKKKAIKCFQFNKTATLSLQPSSVRFVIGRFETLDLSNLQRFIIKI